MMTNLINLKLQRPAASQVLLNQTRKICAALALGGLGLLASSQAVSANTYFSTEAIQGGGVSWQSPIWYTNSTPGSTNGQFGTAVGATTTTGPGNDFEILPNGVAMQSSLGITTVPAIRTDDTGTGPATFQGASLTLNTNTILRIKTFGGLTITNLILKGGVLQPSGANIYARFLGGMNIVSQSYFSDGSDGDGVGPGVASGSFWLSSALSGSGNIYFMNCNNGRLNIVDGGLVNSNFTGKWIIQNGYLRATNTGSLGTNSIIVDPNDTSYLADMPNIAPLVQGAGSATFEPYYDISSAGKLRCARRNL